MIAILAELAYAYDPRVVVQGADLDDITSAAAGSPVAQARLVSLLRGHQCPGASSGWHDPVDVRALPQGAVGNEKVIAAGRAAAAAHLAADQAALEINAACGRASYAAEQEWVKVGGSAELLRKSERIHDAEVRHLRDIRKAARARGATIRAARAAAMTLTNSAAAYWGLSYRERARTRVEYEVARTRILSELDRANYCATRVYDAAVEAADAARNNAIAAAEAAYDSATRDAHARHQAAVDAAHSERDRLLAEVEATCVERVAAAWAAVFPSIVAETPAPYVVSQGGAIGIISLN